MGVITAQLDTRAGSGTVEISEGSLPTGSVEAGEIGELSIEFDMRDVADDADKVFFAPSEFTISLFDKIDDGSSLFKALDNLDASDVAELTLSFTTDDGQSFEDVFEFTKKDVTYKREERSVEIDSKVDINSDRDIQRIFELYSPDVEDLRSQEGNVRNCMPTTKFIENVMDDAIDSPVGGKTFIDYTFKSDIHDTEFPISVIIGGDTYDDDGDGTDENGYIDDDGRISETDATTVLFRLGALSGSIIGSFLGYNFFVRRDYSNDSVSVTEDDTKELEIGLGDKAYRSIMVIINSDQSTDNNENEWGRYADWDYLIGDADGLNSRASKSLELYFYTLELRGAFWNSSTSEYDAGDDHILTNFSEQVVGSYQEGSRFIKITNNSSPVLEKGDLVAFNINPSTGKDLEIRNYLVADSGDDYLLLANPLKTEVQDGAGVYYYDQIFASLPFLTRAEPYAKAYGATGSNMIEVEFFDVDLFDPFQTFIPDSSFPDGVAGNEYRPSELTYDLINDMIKSKAYQID